MQMCIRDRFQIDEIIRHVVLAYSYFCGKVLYAWLVGSQPGKMCIRDSSCTDRKFYHTHLVLKAMVFLWQGFTHIIQVLSLIHI